MRRFAVVVVAMLAAGDALAGDGVRLDVTLGKTVEVKVGYARGWFCDDPSLVTAELVTRDDTNVWIVTGAKLGKTQCRVGTDAYGGPGYLFDLRVVAKKK
jgi:hypothetical protein